MSFFHHTRDRALVLAALAEGPAFGLEVVDRVKRDTGGRVDLGFGVYPVLRELEREGSLRGWEQEGPPSRGGRPRYYYEIVRLEDGT